MLYINERVPKAKLWIINFCILEIKADNEPAISLPVYLSVCPKMKMGLYEKKNKSQR